MLLTLAKEWHQTTGFCVTYVQCDYKQCRNVSKLPGINFQKPTIEAIP